MLTKVDLPASPLLQEAILRALRDLGGAASNEELALHVAQETSLTAQHLSIPHDAARGKRSEFEYRMAWARTKLKDSGLIENTGHKRWQLCKI
jgi:restriction system protein